MASALRSQPSSGMRCTYAARREAVYNVKGKAQSTADERWQVEGDGERRGQGSATVNAQCVLAVSVWLVPYG